MQQYRMVIQVLLIICVILVQMRTTLCDAEGEIRLADNITTMFSVKGRLEIFHDGIWGTVCGDDFDISAAGVVCGQLEEETSGASVYTAGDGTGVIWLDDVRCIGLVTSLTECAHSRWGEEDCNHSDDVGVSCIKEGAIRLAHEFWTTDSVTGRLEIFHSNIWGTVCGDTNLENLIAVVACRQFGENTSGAATFTTENYGTENIWSSNVVCNGTESSLSSCLHSGWGQQYCTHENDLAISCFNGTEGKLRLRSSTRTSNSIYGRLEIYRIGIWGTICNKRFNSEAAKVVCQQLGERTSSASTYKPDLSHDKNIWLSDVVCNGSEPTLLACSNSGWENHNCTHGDDVGISCFNGTEEEMQLSEKTRTQDSVYGILEVKHKGVWGTVCDTYFNIISAKVVCEQLGERSTNAASYIYTEKVTSGQKYMLKDLSCNGSETNIADCSHSGWDSCENDYYLGISCYNGTEVEGNVRLGDRTSTSLFLKGRLEIFHLGIWGTVCDNNFDISAAKVVCTQLGVRTNNASIYAAGYGTGHKWLAAAKCNGSETYLDTCTYFRSYSYLCDDNQDVGVICANTTDDLTLQFDKESCESVAWIAAGCVILLALCNVIACFVFWFFKGKVKDVTVTLNESHGQITTQVLVYSQPEKKSVRSSMKHDDCSN